MLNLAIFGNPISHSKSPLMHNMAFKNLKIEGYYGRYLLEDGSKLKKRFLELKLDGANITVPHKEFAYNLADEIRGIAKEIGAVNTFVLKNSKIIGYNTDADGFFISLNEFGPIKNALILGAGGTAKAITHILIKNNIDVTILNRSKERLDYFKELKISATSFDEFEVSGYDLVINSTSAGLKDSLFPCKKELLSKIFKNAKFAYDVIYGKETPFLKLAKEMGLKIKDGEDMLINQGVLAFLLFTQTLFDFDSVKKEMQKVFRF